MNHEERNNIVSLIATVIVTPVYLAYTLNKFNSATLTPQEELQFWAASILGLILVRVIFQIILFVVFIILESIFIAIKTKNSDYNYNDSTDERDNIISLKGERRISDMFFLGFGIAIIAATLGASLSTMFMVIILSAIFAEIVGILFKIYYYRKGI